MRKRVKVLVSNLPRVGKKGATVLLQPKIANVLILLKKVKEVVEKPKQTESKSQPQSVPETKKQDDKQEQKPGYKRRDMQAENTTSSKPKSGTLKKKTATKKKVSTRKPDNGNS